MRVHVLQHVSFEPPARVADWARMRGHGVATTRPYLGEELPATGAFDALVVMGGPMSVHDERRHRWLADEKRLVGAALDAGKLLLGVCLGAQVLADVLGARVYRAAEREIGWYDVVATPSGRGYARSPLPERFEAFHWHGETYELPAGAVHLARTGACEQQMFALGERVLGLQFHLEVTRAGVADMIRHGGDDLAPGAHVQTADEMLEPLVDFESPYQLLVSILDGWCHGGAT